MGIRYSRLGLMDETYTHVDAEHGIVSCFWVEGMRRAAQGMKVVRTDVDPDFAAHVAAYCGIEQPKLARLVEPWLSLPVFYVPWVEGFHLLVDGHHRYVKHAMLGRSTIKAILFDDYEPFVVEGIPPHILRLAATSESNHI